MLHIICCTFNFSIKNLTKHYFNQSIRMTSHFQGEFAISASSNKSLGCSDHLRSLYSALLSVLPEIPQILTDTPMRLWRGAYMEPGLIRIARAYTINKKRYVINLHVSNLEQDAEIEPHFHPFGNMAVFLVGGGYTNILGEDLDDQGRIVDPVKVRIEEGDAYVMSKSLCHDVEAQTNHTFSIMLHEKYNVKSYSSDDYEKIIPLSDQRKQEILAELNTKYFSTELFEEYFRRQLC